jgi:hypothetical protein
MRTAHTASVSSIIALAWIIAAVPMAWAQPVTKDTTDTAPIEQVIVTAPRLSAEIKSFVQSYAMPSLSAPVVARWKNPICPNTFGFLQQKDDDFVTLRIRQIAASANVRLATPPCRANIQVYFAAKPQALLDSIRSHGGSRLLSANPSQAERLAVFKRPIQAWYATGTRDEYNGVLGSDDIEDGGWSGCICDITVPPMPGSGVRMMNPDPVRAGVRSEFAHIYVIADINQTSSYSFNAVADYIAMLALSEIRTFDACQELPSITNLIVPDCDASRKPGAITETDLAYLRGIYSVDPGEALKTQQSDIAAQMEATLSDARP